MSPISFKPRKFFELAGLFFLATLSQLLLKDINVTSLFCLGFLWNWAISFNLDQSLNSRTHRWSMIKLVITIHRFWLKPFQKSPYYIQRIIYLFPAGCFWLLVCWLNDSTMPWWPAFVGSLFFEISQIDLWRENKLSIHL
jgi:hypothetical protein